MQRFEVGMTISFERRVIVWITGVWSRTMKRELFVFRKIQVFTPTTVSKSWPLWRDRFSRNYSLFWGGLRMDDIWWRRGDWTLSRIAWWQRRIVIFSRSTCRLRLPSPCRVRPPQQHQDWEASWIVPSRLGFILWSEELWRRYRNSNAWTKLEKSENRCGKPFMNLSTIVIADWRNISKLNNSQVVQNAVQSGNRFRRLVDVESTTSAISKWWAKANDINGDPIKEAR